MFVRFKLARRRHNDRLLWCTGKYYCNIQHGEIKAQVMDGKAVSTGANYPADDVVETTSFSRRSVCCTAVSTKPPSVVVEP